LQKATAVREWELDAEECTTLGVADGTIAVPSPECHLLVKEGSEVTLGYELTIEDKQSQDWDLA
jgi:hypothetical protein